MSETPIEPVVETIPINQSILASTKKAIGIHDSYTDFDVDILMHINTAINTLTQLGVGPVAGFMVEDRETSWVSYLGTDVNLNAVKTLIYHKVRLAFDPPGTSFHINAIEAQIKELEWRLNLTVDTPVSIDEDDDELIWVLDDTEPFPAEADEGDVGFDPVTGDVWRKTDA